MLTVGAAPVMAVPNQSTVSSSMAWLPALSLAWMVTVPFLLNVSGADQWFSPSLVTTPTVATSPASTQRSVSARSSIACSVRLTGVRADPVRGKLDDQ